MLGADTYILDQIYGQWEFFYFDEKGNKNNYKVFNNENDACMYMLNVLENEISIACIRK